MKKLINDPRHVVREMLEGLTDLSPGLALLADETVVVRSNLSERQARPVAVLSGGGAGHEPAHAGFVGPGLLTGAVVGDVFTSPSVDAVLAGIRACAGPAGAVLIVKNYTGDRLNFGLAAEIAHAEGIPTEVVVVADDVALLDRVPADRARGIAGTVLVHKVAGSAAAAGKPLAEVAAAARRAASRIGTMGVALTACTVPTVGKPGFSLGDDEIEIGLGIHGEAGFERRRIASAHDLVATLIDKILTGRALKEGTRCALLVNGLGATPPMELSIIAREALAALRAKGMLVERAWTGTLLSALDMAGCSLTVMTLDDEFVAALDAPASSASWPTGGRILAARHMVASPTPASSGTLPTAETSPLAPQMRAALARVATTMREREAFLADLDARAGDGDLGASMVRGAEAIETLADPAWTSPGALLSTLGDALRRAIAGSSGPFYATALMRAARRLASNPAPSVTDWAAAFDEAVTAIETLGGARPGDRTMVDALRPAADAFTRAAGSGADLASAWKDATEAAEAGTEATKSMRPRLGRAAYLGERAIGSVDAGAAAVSIWMRSLLG